MTNLIHVIDDDDAVRESLAFLLGTEGLQVRTYASGQEFLDNLPPASGGCIVTDVRMPGISGLDLVRRLKELGVSLPIVVITGHADVPLAVEAMKAGVTDFIEKPFDDEHMLSVLRSALERQHDTSARDAERERIAVRITALSQRERQVLQKLVAGQANKIIAHELGISPRTVEVYRANLMVKMQAGSLSELVRMAVAANFVE